MIALQEELDWQVLRSYGLVGDDVGPVDDPPPLTLGERAFEIVLARQVEPRRDRDDVVRAPRLDADHRAARATGRPTTPSASSGGSR